MTSGAQMQMRTRIATDLKREVEALAKRRRVSVSRLLEALLQGEFGDRGGFYVGRVDLGHVDKDAQGVEGGDVAALAHPQDRRGCGIRGRRGSVPARPDATAARR